MNSLANLRSQLREQAKEPRVTGQWRTISACLDDNTDEFLNVGVLFAYKGKVEVRMLDHFERIKCLYGNRIDPNDLNSFLMDLEESIIKTGPDLPSKISSTIRLGAPLYAAGSSPEEVVDKFYDIAVTLGRPVDKIRDNGFRYRSTPKLKETVLERMTETLGLYASEIIQEAKYQLRMRSGHRIEVDVPLLGNSAAGGIVSAWYKSPLVVDHNLLQASSDLQLIRSNTDRQKASLSVLVPDKDCGMDNREFTKHHDILHRRLDILSKSGIDIIEATSSEALADLTAEWWKNVA